MFGRYVVCLALSVLSSTLNADTDDNRIFRDDVRDYFVRTFPTHPRAFGRMQFTADVPVDPGPALAQIASAPDGVLAIGYALVLDDVVCRIGLSLSHTGPYTFQSPVQRVKAYCVRVQSARLDPEFLSDSYASELKVYPATEIDLAAVARAITLRFADYRILDLHLRPVPDTRVNGVEIFTRYRPYEHLAPTTHWQVSRLVGVDLTMVDHGPDPSSRILSLAMAQSLWTTCEGTLLDPGVQTFRLDEVPFHPQSH